MGFEVFFMGYNPILSWDIIPKHSFYFAIFLLCIIWGIVSVVIVIVIGVEANYKH
jgi:hypothetical protein